MKHYFLGLDLGQAQDYTAVAVLERFQPGPVPWDGHGAGNLYTHPSARPKEPPAPPSELHLRYLERVPIGTSYPDIVDRTVKLMASPQLRGETELIVDATGVGRPVVDLLRKAGLYPRAVTITGAEKPSYVDGEYRVPKRDLVIGLQVLLQGGRFKVAASLPEWPKCIQELLAFKVKIDKLTANDSYGAAREGDHDDLVLAVALAAWRARQIPEDSGERFEFRVGDVRRGAF